MKCSQDIFLELVKIGHFNSPHPNEVGLLDARAYPQDFFDWSKERQEEFQTQFDTENERRRIHNIHWRSVQAEENVRWFWSQPDLKVDWSPLLLPSGETLRTIRWELVEEHQSP
jgi:hypothetical protein